MNTQVDRRRVLRLLVALGAAVTVTHKSAFSASTECVTKFGGLDPEAIRELGREYEALRPDMIAIDGMAKLLADSPNEASMLAELRTRALADFTGGRIVNLAGWFVSETEGCLFAALNRCE